MNLVLLYPGVSAFEAMGALAALHACGLPGDTVSAEALVHSFEGARLVPHRLGHAGLVDADAVLVPGGDVEEAVKDADLAKSVRARRGRWTLASGDGVRLVAPLAEGRRVAVVPGGAAPAGATASHARLVADGRLLTCTGGDALVDLALHYATHAAGEAAAREGAQRLGRAFQVFAMGGEA